MTLCNSDVPTSYGELSELLSVHQCCSGSMPSLPSAPLLIRVWLLVNMICGVSALTEASAVQDGTGSPCITRLLSPPLRGPSPISTDFVLFNNKLLTVYWYAHQFLFRLGFSNFNDIFTLQGKPINTVSGEPIFII